MTIVPAQAGLIGKRSVFKPKVMIINMFSLEANAWLSQMDDLYANNITVVGLNRLYPQVHCNTQQTICQMTTGEGKSNAASSIMALTLSPKFDLTETFFLISGIAGINPYAASLGSVGVARFAVDIDLINSVDLRELPSYFQSSGWEIDTDPYENGSSNEIVYPESMPYQTNLYELNNTLITAAMEIIKDVVLEDNEKAASYRKLYNESAARRPPFITQCDTATGDNYWAGTYMGNFVSNITNVLTNSTGHYCTTQQEDNASLTALTRASFDGLVNINRVVIMRSGSDFDRGAGNITALANLLNSTGHVSSLACDNLYHAGAPLIDHIVNHWSYWT